LPEMIRMKRFGTDFFPTNQMNIKPIFMQTVANSDHSLIIVQVVGDSKI
jgi:hypothetical protein